MIDVYSRAVVLCARPIQQRHTRLNDLPRDLYPFEIESQIFHIKSQIKSRPFKSNRCTSYRIAKCVQIAILYTQSRPECAHHCYGRVAYVSYFRTRYS